MRTNVLFKLSVVSTLILCAFFAACKQEVAPESGVTAIYAPINEKVNPDSLPLRSKLFQRIDTVRLKTDVLEGCINTVKDVKVTDDYIFVLTSDDERLLVYDMEGSFIRQIGRKGRGRGEYVSLQSFDILPEKDEIYLCSQLTDDINIYSLSGEFKRKISPQLLSLEFAVKSDGHMLFFSEYGNTQKGYDRGVFETDANGNFIKMIFTLPLSYGHIQNNDLFTHISDDEIGCMGFEDEDYIYHIKGDSVYKAYKIKTDIVMDQETLKQKQQYTSDISYYKTIYHESDRLLTVSLIGNGKVTRIYYDKLNHATYRSVDGSDVKAPKEEDFMPMTSSYKGKWVRVHDVLNIRMVPELRAAFPDITEESNPVILIFQN